MTEGMEAAEAGRKSGHTSLLDSGEDFEVVDEEDLDDEPPPLEDAGGGPERSSSEAGRKTPDEEAPLEEWLDVLGEFHVLRADVQRLLSEISSSPSAGNGQLKKKVTASGRGRASRPVKGQNVRIDLKTSLMDGTVVEEQPDFSFTLGDGDVIQVRSCWQVYISVVTFAEGLSSVHFSSVRLWI